MLIAGTDVAEMINISEILTSHTSGPCFIGREDMETPLTLLTCNLQRSGS